MVDKYVIKGLPTIQGPFGHIPFESPGKMRYFPFLVQIFHLSLPKTRQAHPNVNYFFKKYVKRQIIPKSLKALAVIFKLWQALELFAIFSRFLAKFCLKPPLCRSVAMEAWQDLDH